jgi:hypothetical protein
MADTYPEQVERCLGEWASRLDAKKGHAEKVKERTKELAELLVEAEDDLVASMMDHDIDEIQLPSGKLLRVEHRLKQCKAEKTEKTKATKA